MAAASSYGKKRSEYLCKYFANNVCRKGADCPYSHDRTAKPDRICTYYLSGRCAYGDRCRYDHKRNARPDPVPNNNSPKASITTNKVIAVAKAPPNTSSATNFGKHKFSVDAKEFVPSWLKAEETIDNNEDCIKLSEIALCPYNATGHCINEDMCQFLHGHICEFCNLPCLHPFNEEQRKQHHIECIKAHEDRMNEAFAEARSADKICGICLENIREKNSRFGILVGCRHSFCLECIREWRKRHSQVLDKKTVRSCPECRIHSHYVIPAVYWVEDDDEKRELIQKYHECTKRKQCKYMKRGRVNDCPFGNKCFYKHQTPDGVVVEGDSPKTLRRERFGMGGIFFMEDGQFWIDLTESDSDDDFSDILEAFSAVAL